MTESMVFDVVFDDVTAAGEVPTVDVFTVEAAGPPGLSAYEIAVQGGFEGTQAQWIASLKGAPGVTTLTQSAYEALADKAGIYVVVSS